MALVEHYSALMEADHLAAIGKKVVGAGVQTPPPPIEATQEQAVDRGSRDWRGSQSRRELDEDRFTSGASARTTTESRDAIQGRPHRSIPKGSVGRGAIAPRTQPSTHVDTHGRSGSLAVKLGAQSTVLHRPQGFGGGRGSGSISFG